MHSGVARWRFVRRDRLESPVHLRSPVRGDPRLDSAMTEARNAQQQDFRPLPGLLGWLVPGLGHVVIGERLRGALVFGGILYLWMCGVFIGGIDSVDRREDPLWFAAQVCSGPIALGVDGLNRALLKTGQVGELLESPPVSRNSGGQKVSSFKGIAHVNEYGILFTGLAGLMNLIAIIDASTRGPADRRRSGS